MDILRHEIDLAAEHGVNHIQLSHGLVHYAEQVLESSDLRDDIAELIERAHRQRIEVMLWTHEMQNVPAHFRIGGKVDLSSRRTWDYVANKYDELFAELPKLDGVVLTLTETRIRIDDDNEVVSNRPPAQRIARMISMINQICHKHKAQLIVRSFTWVPRTMLWYAEAMRSVPDDVTVMTKESWGDWYQYSPPNQLLGLFGRHPQIMEVDCWGEYAGGTEIPWVSARHIQSRLRLAKRYGLAGAVARVDRREQSTFGTVNEFNTFAFSRMMKDPEVDLDELRDEWLVRTYPAEATQAIARALDKTNEIVQCIYFNRGIKGVTTNEPTLVAAEADSTNRFWRDFHGQWDPEMAVRGEQLLNPTEETLISLVSEKDRAISLCDQALADVDEARPHLSQTAYESLRSGFERARVLAAAWRAMTEVTYLHRLLEQDPTPRLRGWFDEAGQRLLGTADEIEQTYGKGFSLARPEPLRQLWYAAENLHSERVAWSLPLGLYLAATPAVADLDGDGCPEIVAVSSHKEITAISGKGKRLWTVTTRGERYEYPHFSSPLVIPGAAESGVRILVGAADGRLYCLGGDGTRLWEHATGNRVDAAPAAADIDGDGRTEILVGSLDGRLTCLSDAGERKWSVGLDEAIFATPAITPTNEVIVASLQGTIACINSRGVVRWRQTLVASPVEHRLYHGVPDGRLYALSEGGAGAIYASPLVADLNGDGIISLVIGVSTGRLLVYDMHGNLQWEAATGSPIYSSPCVIRRGTRNARVVVGSNDGRVHAIDTAGRPVWQFETGGPARSSPVVVPAEVAGTENILVGSSDHRVYVLDTEGRELEEYHTGGEVFGAPLVADVNGDGLAEIIVGSYDHRVYAFRTLWKVCTGQVVVGTFRAGPTRQGA